MAQLALYMEEVLEISDDVFQNDLGIQPPQHKTRREVDAFVKAVDEVGMAAENKKQEVAKNLEANGRDEVQLRILEKLDDLSASMVQLNTSYTELRSEISEMKTHFDTSFSQLKNEISDLRTHVDTPISDLRTHVDTSISDLRTHFDTSISDLRTHFDTSIFQLRNESFELGNELRASLASLGRMLNSVAFLTIVHENQRRRKAKIFQLPLPLLRPEFVPENHNLRHLLSVEDINGLEVEELRLYLDVYNIPNDTIVDRKRLKVLLRDILGFTSTYELIYEMV